MFTSFKGLQKCQYIDFFFRKGGERMAEESSILSNKMILPISLMTLAVNVVTLIVLISK